MKYNAYLLITLSCYSPCMAMEKEQANIKEITSIVFLPNNRVVVGGEDGCNIFDSHSQQPIKQLTFRKVVSLTANKDTIAIIDSNQNKYTLNIFDTTTQEKKWSIKTDDSHVALNALHNTIVTSTGYYVDIYKKENPVTATKSFFVGGLNYRSITCNPTNNTLLYTTGTGLCIAHPSKYLFNPNFRCMELIPLQDIRAYHDTRAIQDSILSPDGHTILFKYNMVWRKYAPYFIYDLNDEKEVAHYILDSKYYNAFAFHPTLTLLAALSEDNRVKFWDYAAHKLIATTHQLSSHNYPKNNSDRFTQQLSFAPNGEQLAVVLPDSWHIINVPSIPKHPTLVLYALRTNVPEDIVRIIVQYMMGHSSFSYIDIANFIKVAPLTMSTATEPDLSQETQRKCVQKWIECKDPDASSSDEDYF